jgi:hypothetical protein
LGGKGKGKGERGKGDKGRAGMECIATIHEKDPTQTASYYHQNFSKIIV